MIFGNIGDIEKYCFTNEKIKSCFNYLKTHYMSGFENGSHKIDGDELYVNIFEYTTQLPEKRFFEAHRKYADVHFVISGEEQIDINFIKNMKSKIYDEEEDSAILSGTKNASVILRPGDFLVCLPEDAHRTAVEVNGPSMVHKAVFKVKI